jgi:ribosomal protein S18 acetylase RimI-like enzyme
VEFGFISDLTVRVDMRRQGVGRRLLDHVFDWFRARGVANVQLQVYERNTKGRAFWESQGFEPFFQRMWRKI